jgi:hypothetical protein
MLYSTFSYKIKFITPSFRKKRKEKKQSYAGKAAGYTAAHVLGVGTKGVERRRKEEVCLCSVVNHNLSRQGRWSPLAVQTDIPARKKRKKKDGYDHGQCSTYC